MGSRRSDTSLGVHTEGSANRLHPLVFVGKPPPRTARSPGPTRPGAPRRRSGSAGDLAGLQAAGAHVEALAGAVDGRPDPLDVGVEAPLGDLLRPRPVVAEARLLGADVADGSHGSHSWIEVDRGPRGAGNRTRISDAPPRTRISGPGKDAHYPGTRPADQTRHRGATRSVRHTMEAPTGGGIELAVVRRFVDVAVDALADAREEIDALNVYPVPDGDTGTNMYLTVSAARDAIHQATAEHADLPTALAAFRRGALLGARGNSGVILSQMLGGIAARIARAAPEERNAVVMAEAMSEATEASYAAVGTPVEGTILTVARAAADAAVRRAGDPRARARDVFSAAAAAAREALAHTPEQLEQLRL